MVGPKVSLPCATLFLLGQVLWTIGVLGYTQGFKSGTKDLRLGKSTAAGMDFDYEIDGIYIDQIAYEGSRNF